MRFKVRPGARRALKIAAALALAAAVAWALLALLRRRARRRDGYGGSPAAAILGGAAANPADYPWFCHFVATTDMWGSLPKPVKHVMCGGALISPSLVLTSMHGTDIKPGSDIVIGGRETRKVKASWRHPFTQIYVIHLATPSTMRPIKMAAALPAPGTSVAVVGRGLKGSSFFVPEGQISAMMADQTLRRASLVLTARKQGPAEFTLASPAGAVVCDGDMGSPVFLPKGQGGRAEDLLLGIAAGSECYLANEQSTRASYAYSIPFFNRMSPRAEAVGRFLRRTCYGTFAPRLAGNTCPKGAPWDTGLTTDRNMYGFEAVLEYARNPCAKTRQCAQTVRDAYATFLNPATPAVRHNA